MTIPPPYSSNRRSREASSDITRAIVDAAGGSSADGREELREFFAAISGLGKRTRERYEQLKTPRSRRWLLAVCSVLVIGGLLFQYISHQPPSEIPVDLRGAWTTTAKSYADRGFWIGTHEVAFRVGAGPHDIQIYPVTHLAHKRISGDTTVYDIDYAVDGGTDRWSIRHVALPHPAITFVHQPQMIWTAVADTHPPVR